jgi:hypothetical protein
MFRLEALDTKHRIIKYLSLAVDAVTCEPFSLPAPPKFPLFLANRENTGNFASSYGSNYTLFHGNPRPEPVSRHHTCFRRKSEQGINRDRIRELTGAYQGKNRESLLEAKVQRFLPSRVTTTATPPTLIDLTKPEPYT